MDVSVIIVNYKTSGLIANCLVSIFRLTEGIEYEIIIVDNNSEPDFQEKILEKSESEGKENIHFISLPENIGFGRANNEGLKIAKGRNILFLNPDTVLLNNAIKILSDFLDTHPESGACGGNLYDFNLNPTQSFRRWLPGPLWEFDELLNANIQNFIFGKSQKFNYKGKPIEVGFITGADLMVKNIILGKIGSFSPEFFMYYEETDLCCRIKKAGYKIFNVPEARIQHLEGMSFLHQKNPERKRRYAIGMKLEYMEISREKYLRRNVGTISYLLSNIIYGMFLNSRVIMIRDKEKQEYYRHRQETFRKLRNNHTAKH